MSIFAANLSNNESELYGFSCLRCRAITRSSYKITVPGDDTETFLTLGQREQVYCPICRDMKQGEFVVITNMNATKVVDSVGNQVYPNGLGGGGYSSSNTNNNGAPNMATGGFAPPPPPPPQSQYQQQQPPTGMYLQGTVAPAGTAPSPLSSSSSAAAAPLLNAGFSMPSNQAFEKHLLNISDDEVRALKKDLQVKLQLVENAVMERRKCIVCCERDKCVVLLPCKHMSLCQECSDKVKECPVCKKEVVDRIVPFAS